ncbi:MAG: DUF2147 domain-containing protein [Pseudomonadota bacterium]|nr:DUF2147 domain-containing protein [Pseudomonadota bacterium]
MLLNRMWSLTQYSYFLLAILLCTGLSVNAQATPTSHPQASPTSDDIIGFWRTIDDVTGFAAARIQISKDATGKYVGTVRELFPRPNYTPIEKCQNCPKPFTDRQVVGMPILWNLQANPDNPNLFNRGYVIDPLNGRIYAGDVKLSRDRRIITLRGKIIGAGVFNRSQTWRRDPDQQP